MWILLTSAALIMATQAGAVDRGALLFRGHCGSCHDPEKAGHTPGTRKLRRMSTDAVLKSMVTGSMKSVAARMTDSERQMVAEYVTGKPLKSPSVETSASRQGIEGRWNWDADCQGRAIKGQFAISLPDSSGKFAVSFYDSSATGRIERSANSLRIRFVRNSDPKQDWTGAINGDRITGTLTAPERPPCEFQARRASPSP